MNPPKIMAALARDLVAAQAEVKNFIASVRPGDKYSPAKLFPEPRRRALFKQLLRVYAPGFKARAGVIVEVGVIDIKAGDDLVVEASGLYRRIARMDSRSFELLSSMINIPT